MFDLEERILQNIDLKPYVLWCYIDYIFFIWQHREEHKICLSKDSVNFILPSSLRQNIQKKSTQFLDKTIDTENGVLKTGLLVKPTDTHEYLESSSSYPTLTIIRKVFITDRLPN